MNIQDRCAVYAARYEALGSEPEISGERATTLKSIANTWTVLSYQLERLANIIEKETTAPLRPANHVTRISDYPKRRMR